VVVGGHAIEALRAYLATRRAPRVTVVTNPAFATTNTLASLVCAAPAVDGDVFLLDGDLVFEPAVLARLDGPGTRLAVDRGRPLDDDAVKVATDGDRVVAVGKALPDGRRGEAESIGLARIDAAAAPALFATGRALLAAGATAAYYEAAFQRLIDDGVVLQAADVTSLKWEEIDDHADLRRAHSLFAAA